MSASAPIPRWLLASVVLPVLVLAALAVQGLRSQHLAAMERAREQAKVLVELQADFIGHELAARIHQAADYPSPPKPNPKAITDDPLESKDPAILLAVARDPGAGFSPAGLPRRVLAALRLRDLQADGLSAAETIELVVRQSPSILTTTVLQSLKSQAPDSVAPALAEWHSAQSARSARKLAGEDGWTHLTNGSWWTKPGEGNLEFLGPDDWGQVLKQAQEKLPAWAALQLRHQDEVLHFIKPGQPTASAPIEFPPGLFLDLVVANPQVLFAESRWQNIWTITLVLVALIVPCVAILLLRAVILRERRLANLKSQFVASVSHELRAPVGSIRLMAEALHEGKVVGDTAREFHALIASEGARLSHLVENVLDVARIEEGKKRYRFEDCNLTDLVRDAGKLIAPLARERGVEIHPDLGEVSATVDPHAIQQAVLNLLDNAVKFSPSGTTVDLVLEETSSNAWKILIRDHGPGIPPEEHERIFERFHRLGNELRRETQGTGIGLSIVKHIITAHGGRVSVDSNPGQGSTFILTAPLAQTQDT